MEMNPTLNSTLSSTTSETVANNSVAIYKNEGTPFEKDQAGKNDDEKQEAEEDNDEIASTIRTDALRFELQKSDVMSYISRLMQDPGFRHYVDTIQAFIQSFPGGEEMLWQTAQTQPNVSVANDEEDT